MPTFKCRKCDKEIVSIIPEKKYQLCKECRPPVEISFGMIDCKDSNTVSCYTTGHEELVTEHNTRLAMQLDKEYLTKLDALQKRLEAKYSPLFKSEENAKDEYIFDYDEIMKEVWGNTDKYDNFDHLFYH